MKIVLITTTIHVPEVLRQYRALDPDVEFIIAGDAKSPHGKIGKLCREIGGATYLEPEDQTRAHFDLSDEIGWSCVQRRNLALLEAMTRKPDVIVSIDDDNAPRGEDYFERIRAEFDGLASGPLARGEWFNLGELAQDRYVYRGHPWHVNPSAKLGPSTVYQVGILNGLIYGDPDINATERIEIDPYVNTYASEVNGGIALDPRSTWSPVNSQNTAWRADLAPLAFVLPDVGRYDDIWASYFAQACLGSTAYLLKFGEPSVTQERNPHDLTVDLEAEILGMRHTETLLWHLRAFRPDVKLSPLENLRDLTRALRHLDFLPHGFFDEWISACEGVG